MILASIGLATDAARLSATVAHRGALFPLQPCCSLFRAAPASSRGDIVKPCDIKMQQWQVLRVCASNCISQVVLDHCSKKRPRINTVIDIPEHCILHPFWNLGVLPRKTILLMRLHFLLAFFFSSKYSRPRSVIATSSSVCPSYRPLFITVCCGAVPYIHRPSPQKQHDRSNSPLRSCTKS